MNKEDFTIKKDSIYNKVEFKKLKYNACDNNNGSLRLYCRQHPYSFILQLRTVDKNNNSQYMSINISANEIIAMAEYVKNELKSL